jgi:hypothetical protein
MRQLQLGKDSHAQAEAAGEHGELDILAAVALQGGVASAPYYLQPRFARVLQVRIGNLPSQEHSRPPGASLTLKYVRPARRSRLA